MDAKPFPRYLFSPGALSALFLSFSQTFTLFLPSKKLPSLSLSLSLSWKKLLFLYLQVLPFPFHLFKETPLSNLWMMAQAAESYVADGRLGYMEPCPGVELYVCPPGSTTSRLLPADALPPSESPSELGGGTPLVGVVVWRRALLSPRPPKQPSSKSNKVPLSRKPKIPPPSPREQERVVDDVPPGFGPPREDDDLPEFDFRRTSFSGPDSAVQMRELIQKYGSHSGPVASKPLWEDDDDIPEWKPQQLAPPPQPPQPQPQFHPHVAVQPGAWQPYGGGHGFVAGDRRGVMDWRYDVHRSRGM